MDNERSAEEEKIRRLRESPADRLLEAAFIQHLEQLRRKPRSATEALDELIRKRREKAKRGG